jgi:hypothetical protein
MESLEAIVNGSYPASRTDARNFAGFAMQVMYGDHNPAVHVVGYIEYGVPGDVVEENVFVLNLIVFLFFLLLCCPFFCFYTLWFTFFHLLIFFIIDLLYFVVHILARTSFFLHSSAKTTRSSRLRKRF